MFLKHRQQHYGEKLTVFKVYKTFCVWNLLQISKSFDEFLHISYILFEMKNMTYKINYKKAWNHLISSLFAEMYKFKWRCQRFAIFLCCFLEFEFLIDIYLLNYSIGMALPDVLSSSLFMFPSSSTRLPLINTFSIPKERVWSGTAFLILFSSKTVKSA